MAVEEILVQSAFGDAGRKVVIEQTLVGQEASILALVEGNTILTLEASQDHKRAGDGDTGPNTGGMGAYSPTPMIPPEVMAEIEERILIHGPGHGPFHLARSTVHLRLPGK